MCSTESDYVGFNRKGATNLCGTALMPYSGYRIWDLIVPLGSLGNYSLKSFSFFAYIVLPYSLHQHKTVTSENPRVADLGLGFTVPLPWSVCICFWQHSSRLMGSMDQPLMFFMAQLERFAWSLSFSPQVVLAQESNLTATSPFLLILRTTAIQSKIMWQSKALQVIELGFFFFLII